jgi:hypothetical protein
MKIKRIIVSFFVIISIESTEAQTIPYYPLHINDRWEYNDQLSKVIKDTTIDSKDYSVIIHSDTTLGETRYERCDSGRVYRFNIHILKEELWFDFTRNLGDTVSVLVRSSDTLRTIFYDTSRANILGVPKKVWHFFTTTGNSDLFYGFAIADSIGIVYYFKYGFDGWRWRYDTLSIAGAFIDGKLMRTNYPFIFLPFQPGNWWKFDDSPGMVSIVKDTLMPNDKTYALVLWGSAAKYFRQDRHFVFRYNTESQQEEIEMDMSAPAGQIWDLDLWHGYLDLSVSEGIRDEMVFSTNRKTFSYGSYAPQFADASLYYTYADSIGIIHIHSMLYTELLEAQVNGKHYVITSVGFKQLETPNKYLLEQNFPNPFNASTQIKYTISEKSKVLLNVYDILGRKVKTIVDAIQERGTYSINVDLPGIASGVYFYRLMTNNQVQITRKMLLTK